MSVRVMSKAWDTDLNTTEKMVLLALADWSNDEGQCWPSVAQLIRKCGLSERAVQGAIKRLCNADHLTQTIKVGKGANYIVHPRIKCATPPQLMRPADNAPPQQTTQTPAAAADNTSVTTKIPFVISNDMTFPANDVQVEESDESLKPAEVVEAWNIVAKRKGLPLVKKLTRERQRRLGARLKDHTIDEFTEAIKAIDRSPFLHGDNNRGWRADFDFLLQPNSFTKLIEGAYDRAEPKQARFR